MAMAKGICWPSSAVPKTWDSPESRPDRKLKAGGDWVESVGSTHSCLMVPMPVVSLSTALALGVLKSTRNLSSDS